MEVISGISNWHLTFRREADHAVLLRAVTCDSAAVLPDALFGLPITELADHALAPSARSVEGEELTITCGVPEGEFDNRNLCTLTLPCHLQKIGSYAFLNCRALEALRLSGELDTLGADAFMNCRSFSRIDLSCASLASCRTLALLVETFSNELSAVITQEDGSEIRLLFPEYREVTDENVPNHSFSYVISGPGYPYHFLAEKKRISLSAYDALWEKFLSAEHDPLSALRMAWWRVRYPFALAEEARAAYTDFLSRHCREALRLVLEEKDASGLRLLLRWAEPSAEELSYAQQLSRSLSFTEASALLLEEQHRRFPPARMRSFDL